MGAALTLKHPALANVRKWRVKGFDNHLVFYAPRAHGVSIVRVLHAAIRSSTLQRSANAQPSILTST